MTSLALNSVMNNIRSRILLSGPITVAEYMKTALTLSSQPQQNQSPTINGNVRSHKNFTTSQEQGYYMKQDVFGAKGDFTTSPEISQLFGEMVGIWGFETWRKIGGPKDIFKIVELGPGRGTLVKDILRTVQRVGKIKGNEIEVHLIEVSPYLTDYQSNTLLNSEFTRNGVRFFWHKDLSTVPTGFSFYLAHEFFDALPIHKLTLTEKGWREILIDVEGNGSKMTDDLTKFRYVVSREETPAISLVRSFYPSLLNVNSHRTQLELSIDSLLILQQLNKRINSDGGVGLIVDYGHEGTKGDTFRAFSSHSLVHPLERPGEVDLTADVDFSIFNTVCENEVWTLGPVEQREFLTGVGISLRLKMLEKVLESEKEKSDLVSGYKMLMEDMGSRFYAYALLPHVLKQYASKLKITSFS